MGGGVGAHRPPRRALPPRPRSAALPSHARPAPRVSRSPLSHPPAACLQGAGHKVDTLEPPIPPGFGSKVLDAAGAAMGGLGADGHSFELR